MNKKITFFVILMGIVGQGWSGGVEGNGGNDQIQEKVRQWLDVSEKVRQDLETWAKPHLSQGLAERFQKAVKVTRFIDPVDHPLERKGAPVVEKNYPLPIGISLDHASLYEAERLPRIEYVSEAFGLMGIIEKKAIVFHAYLGILREEENHYLFSQRYRGLLVERGIVAETFRTEIREHLGSLREGLHAYYSPSFEKLVMGLERIKTESSYQICANQHEWSVWRYVTVSKQEQWKACFDLYSELKRYYWLVTDGEKELIFNDRWNRFETWGEGQTDEHRKTFLREIRSRLLAELDVLALETGRLTAARNESMRRGCGEVINDDGESVGWQLPLDKTVVCAVDYLKSLFSQEFPALWETKRFQLRQIFESQFDFCATFEE